MLPEIKRQVSEILQGKKFSVCLDLGCGEGYYGDLLKKHCDLLIGVDHNVGRLAVALKYAGYDQCVFKDIRQYNPPSNTQAVFMLDVLEHIPKADGYDLLLKLRNIPFIIITTPSTYHHFTLRNSHLSLWTEKELQEQGFQTKTFSLGLIGRLFSPEIIAWRRR